MKRFLTATLGAIALTATLTVPAHASVNWMCKVPGVVDPVTFVSVPDVALHGISQANSTAGQVFHDQFGEECSVVVVP
jgi:hypothetical protein